MTSCSALSACSETPGSDVVVVVDALVQPLKAITAETAKAATAVSLVLFMIYSIDRFGWMRVCVCAFGWNGEGRRTAADRAVRTALAQGASNFSR